MNCKPGDLAVVVRSQDCPAWIGRIVEVEGNPVQLEDGFAWFTNPSPPMGLGFYDECLRPIRDNDGEDQTLTWAGTPSDIKTPEAA